MRFTPRPRIVPDRPLSELRAAIKDRGIDQVLNYALEVEEYDENSPSLEHPLSFRERLALWRRFFASTPGRLVIVTATLIILSIALSSVAIIGAYNRQQELENLLQETEPLAHASQQLYSSLSLAETSATTQFMTSTARSDVERQYQRAIINAGSAAVQSGAGTTSLGRRDRNLLASINSQLPIYTGLIGEATAEQTMNNPYSAVHQSEARALMREKLLPAAEELYLSRYADISAAQKSWSRPFIAAAVCLALLVVALLIAQVWLSYLTRRRFNGGLLTATVMTVVSLLWVVVASTVAFTTADLSSGTGTDESMIEVLTRARITSQQSHSEEMLQLSQSNAGSRIDSQKFRTNLEEVTEALQVYQDHSNSQRAPELVTEAREALAGWNRSHQSMVKALARGDRRTATNMVTGTNPESENGQFARLDNTLQRAITDARKDIREGADVAHTTLLATVIGLILLLIFTIIAVVMGFVPRFREYE